MGSQQLAAHCFMIFTTLSFENNLCDEKSLMNTSAYILTPSPCGHSLLQKRKNIYKQL